MANDSNQVKSIKLNELAWKSRKQKENTGVFEHRGKSTHVMGQFKLILYRMHACMHACMLKIILI